MQYISLEHAQLVNDCSFLNKIPLPQVLNQATSPLLQGDLKSNILGQQMLIYLSINCLPSIRTRLSCSTSFPARYSSPLSSHSTLHRVFLPLGVASCCTSIQLVPCDAANRNKVSICQLPLFLFIFPFSLTTCFGPYGPSSGEIYN
jgi:hypothetical protein